MYLWENARTPRTIKIVNMNLNEFNVPGQIHGRIGRRARHRWDWTRERLFVRRQDEKRGT